MDISLLLVSAQSSDPKIRQPAVAALDTLQQQNLGEYMTHLTAVLVNENSSAGTRSLAGIMLKNRLSSSVEQKYKQFCTEWLNIAGVIRDNIKAGVLQTLSSPASDARNAAAQACSKIALVELPVGQWPNLLDILLNNMAPTSPSAFLKQATLNTLGYICEEIELDVIKNPAQILTAVVQGMRQEEPSAEVKLAAASALQNALEFSRDIFDDEKAREYVISVILGCITEGSEAQRVAAYACLVKFASLYYKYLPAYIQTIFNMTLESIKKDPQPVALQALEFWSTVCEEEIFYNHILEENLRDRIEPTVQCFNFIKGAVKFLTPLVLEALTKQDENADEDSWDIAMAGSTCLTLIASCVGNDIIPEVVGFVKQFILHTDWHFREAAVMAFGSILEGPEGIHTLIADALPILVQHLKDPHPSVKDSTAWTLGRICLLHPRSIRGEPFNHVMAALLEALKDVPRVATYVCYALHNIAQAFDDQEYRPAENYSQYFEPAILALLAATDREDSDEENLKISAYEAMNELIAAADQDCHRLVNLLVPILMDRLNKTFSMQILTSEDRDEQNNTQDSVCNLLQACISKLGSDIRPYADTLVELHIKVFDCKNAAVHEQAIMSFGCIADVMEQEFEKYMGVFYQYLLLGLRNYQESSVCATAVGVVGDISRALQKKLLPYCDDLFSALIQLIRTPDLDQNVRPPILTCFGDIALAIGGDFVKYLHAAMSVLAAAAGTQITDYNDDEVIDYHNQLRESIFEGYTGIIQGLRADPVAIQQFLPFCRDVIHFVVFVCNDQTRSDTVTCKAVAVLGDVCITLGDQVKQLLRQDEVKKVVEICINSDDASTHSVADWVQTQIAGL